VRAILRFVVQEPFFQFVVLGLLIWGGVEYWQSRNNHYLIQVGPADRQRIALGYLRQFGQPPTAQQLRGLIDQYVREEIFWREGLALRLDKDDEIVRRRVVQKYEFLQTDLAAPAAPAPEALARWFKQHESSYRTAERVAFTQVYFSPDKDGDAAAKDRAVQALKELQHTRAERAPALGDAFPGPTDVSSLGEDEAKRLFGDSELVTQLFKVPLAQWSGPFRSGYGWHVIYMSGHSAPAVPALAEIHERVLADYLDEQRRLGNERAFQKLKARYTVRYDGTR